MWYGLYQAGHVVLNSLYLAGILESFPPSPPAGWTTQAVHLFTGMAALDLLNAALSLVFVAGYWRGRPWSVRLGTITLTVSLYAAALFTYGTLASGAWAGHELAYLWFYLPFIPVVVLAVWSMVRPADLTRPLSRPTGSRGSPQTN